MLIEGLVLFRSGRGRCDSGRDWLVVLDGYLQTEYTFFLSILTLCQRRLSRSLFASPSRQLSTLNSPHLAYLDPDVNGEFHVLPLFHFRFRFDLFFTLYHDENLAAPVVVCL